METLLNILLGIYLICSILSMIIHSQSVSNRIDDDKIESLKDLTMGDILLFIIFPLTLIVIIVFILLWISINIFLNTKLFKMLKRPIGGKKQWKQ